MIIGYSFPKHQFQSTLPQGERRLCAHFSRVQIFNFNPRSRKGSDIQHPVYRHDSAYFNPRSRKGSDFQPAGKDPFRLTFQSTLPQGERLKSGICTSPDLRISIHAPARGAPFSPQERILFDLHFNPRSRKGSDAVAVAFRNHKIISIHAPARGATF